MSWFDTLLRKLFLKKKSVIPADCAAVKMLGFRKLEEEFYAPSAPAPSAHALLSAPSSLSMELEHAKYNYPNDADISYTEIPFETEEDIKIVDHESIVGLRAEDTTDSFQHHSFKNVQDSFLSASSYP